MMDGLLVVLGMIGTGLLFGLIVGAVLCLAITIYFLPALIATKRNHPQQPMLVAANTILGWTFWGWVFCFIWAFARRG